MGFFQAFVSLVLDYLPLVFQISVVSPLGFSLASASFASDQLALLFGILLVSLLVVFLAFDLAGSDRLDSYYVSRVSPLSYDEPFVSVASD